MNLHQLFYAQDYSVAFRFRPSGDDGFGEGWNFIPATTFSWYADPFVIEHEGKVWLFVERMDRWRRLGSIAVCQILDNGKITRFRDVIVEPFHLSYPNVFEYNGDMWMIPESGGNRDIRLYVATDFPYNWKFVKSLYQGANFVDTSFVTRIVDDKAILNSYDWDTRRSVFLRFDLQKMECNQLPDSPGVMDERCGGNSFEKNGETFRVLQDCSTSYGSKIIIRRIDNLDFERGMAKDSPQAEFLPSDFDIKTG